ncbi:hypothetical protein [Streptomyces angustmyceticus]|uniref:hypothetical protein n=1 Tax=Streptomyces angustmyceticus TaxID=285578 RepID=UPI00344DB049
MNVHLTDPQQPHTTSTSQPDLTDQARDLVDAVEDALRIPTFYRDPSPRPAIGATPPVPQPGRPPMSQKATDASALMLSGSVLTAVVGGSATAVLWASGYADPAVVGLICAAPVALAVPVLALSRLVKRAKEAEPPVHHHHYNGAVIHQDQRSVSSKTSGVWAKTRNELPR